MSDLISRDDAIRAVHEEFDEVCVWDESGLTTANEVESILDGLPSAEPKTGGWKQISPAKIYECSECGQNVMTGDIETYKFCHGCGARMLGEDGE